MSVPLVLPLIDLDNHSRFKVQLSRTCHEMKSPDTPALPSRDELNSTKSHTCCLPSTWVMNVNVMRFLPSLRFIDSSICEVGTKERTLLLFLVRM